MLFGVIVALVVGFGYLIFSAHRADRAKTATELFDELVGYHQRRPDPSRWQELADGIWSSVPAARPVVEAIGPKERGPKEILDDLAAIGPDAIGLLQEKLTSSDDRVVRYCAARALGRVLDQQSIVCMAGLLDDEDMFLRVIAIDAMARIGGPGALEALARKLRDDTYDTVFELVHSELAGWPDFQIKARAYIAWRLGHYGRTEAIPALLEAANATDQQLSEVSIWALTKLGATPSDLAADANE